MALVLSHCTLAVSEYSKFVNFFFSSSQQFQILIPLEQVTFSTMGILPS